jgi:predicted nucleic acid-binding Zn finger protein
MSLSVYAKALQTLVDDLSDLMQERNANDEEHDSRRHEDEIKNILLALSSLVGSRMLDKALAISSTKKAVFEIRAECGRSAFRVKGDTGEYKVLSVGYCDCHAFSSERSGSYLPICKHILAAHLAKAQGTAEVLTVSDLEWAKQAWGITSIPTSGAGSGY